MQILSPHSKAQSIIDTLMSHEGHLSYSSISAFMETPEKFIDYKTGHKEETEAMIYGAMLHCLVLEPHDFNNRYYCLEDEDICAQIGGAKPRATKAYKEWKDTAIGEAQGKIIVKTDDYVAAKIAADSVLKNRASRKVLNMCPEREVKAEWEYLNFKFQGYKDCRGDKAIADLKSMPDADPDVVQREIVKRKLHVQAAMYIYSEGEYKDYYIIAVDKMKGVSVHKLHQKLIEKGMEEYDDILNKFNQCILTDSFDQSYDFWSDRADGIFVCEPPKWLF